VASPRVELSLSDWAVLGVVAQRPTHGWPVVRALAADGTLGRVWTVGRPVVYRSLTTLADAGLIEPAGDAPGVRGPQRTIMRVTRSGRSALRKWLATPVVHVRDIRTEFLLKLALLDEANEPHRELVNRQLAALAPVFDAMSARTKGDAFERALALWRREQALAVQRFLRSLEKSR
jgi:PadR family transcriptional regulator AphA